MYETEFKKLKKNDLSKMHIVYDTWAKRANETYKNSNKSIKLQKTSHLVFAGMGGSGAIGDVFGAILSKTNIHVSIVKGYNLPNTVNKDTMVIITSVSGDTKETVEILRKSIKIGTKIIVFSGGGKLKELCKIKNIDHINIIKDHSPRASFIKFLFSMLGVLKPILPIEEKDIMESIRELKKISKTIHSENFSESNQAIQIAKWIKCTPIIYYPFGLQAAATRFKNSLQENCKMHVITEDVIEACHNGIVAWEKDRNFQPIFLRGADDQENTIMLWKALKKYMKKNKIQYKEIFTVKGNILTKLVCMIYLLDYSTIYLSSKLGIDPSPVKSIEFIKKELNKK